MSEHYPKQIERVLYSSLKLAANPRSLESISQESIRELGEDVLLRGITDPLRVRVAPDGSLEVWDGQRRFLGFGWAMELAAEGRDTGIDLSVIPIINDGPMTDAEMLEKQMHGFVQREELTPKDEAIGLQRLCTEFGRSMVEVSRAIGRSGSYVSNRITLLRAPERAWKAWAADRLTLRHLELIGALPLAADRETFTKQILEGDGGIPLRVAEAQALRDKDYAVQLAGTLFDRDDAQLVQVYWKDDERAGGGACNAECPFFSGADKRPTCTNLTCYDLKQRKAWKAIQSNAIESGKRWMDVDASAQIFTIGKKLELSEECEFIDLNARPGFKDTGNYDPKHPVWCDLLEGTEGAKRSITALHPKGRKVYQLLEREVAIKLVIEADPSKEALFAKRPGAAKKAVPEPVAVVVPQAPVTNEVNEASSGKERGGEVETREQLEAREVATVTACENPVILGEQIAVMQAMHEAWSRSDEICPKVERMMLEQRLATLPGAALRLMCLTLWAEPGAVIAKWGNDACIRMILKGEEDPSYLLMVAELAVVLVRNNEGTLELLKVVKPLVESVEGNGKTTGRDAEDMPEMRTTEAVEQIAEDRIEPLLPEKEAPRTAKPDAEVVAWEVYLRTGSRKEAAMAAKVPLDTVKSWVRRRGWKEKRDEEMAKPVK